MTLKPGLTVFIPVFNEEVLLVENVTRVVEFLDLHDTPYEIIIGSNGSTDRSVELAGELCDRHKNIRFFHLPEKGVGAAFREGVKIVGYDRIVTVDLDLSINLEFINMAYLMLDQYDIVIGSKIKGSQERSLTRTIASNIFIALARFLLQIDFHDYSIAAKGYRKEIVERYLPYIDDQTFYVVEIVYHAYHDGKNLKEIPVRCHDMRESRFNLMEEGVYKFANLFRLWLASIKRR